MKNSMIDTIMTLFGKKTSCDISSRYRVIFTREISELDQMLFFVNQSISCLLGELDDSLIGKRQNISRDINHESVHVYGARMRYTMSRLEKLRNDLLMRLEEAKRNRDDLPSLVGPV